jgi:hypothetical protein
MTCSSLSSTGVSAGTEAGAQQQHRGVEARPNSGSSIPFKGCTAPVPVAVYRCGMTAARQQRHRATCSSSTALSAALPADQR